MDAQRATELTNALLHPAKPDASAGFGNHRALFLRDSLSSVADLHVQVVAVLENFYRAGSTAGVAVGVGGGPLNRAGEGGFYPGPETARGPPPIQTAPHPSSLFGGLPRTTPH